MAKRELVSIIVPIYNAQDTIRRCLDSICAQTYKEIEILAIDDGSTDDSRKILEEYEKKDDRVRPIFKENSGVSASRNLGMSLAKGTYLQFADSDDWVSPFATERLVNAIEKDDSQMAVCDYYRVTGKKFFARSSVRKGGLYTLDEFAECMLTAPANFYYGVMWNKLYVTAIVRRHHLACTEGMNWCEDFLFNLEYMGCIRKISVVKKPLYYYLKRKGSLVTKQMSPANVLQTKRRLFTYYKKLYENLDLYEENRLKVQSFYLSVAHEIGERVDDAKVFLDMEPDGESEGNDIGSRKRRNKHL